MNHVCMDTDGWGRGFWAWRVLSKNSTCRDGESKCGLTFICQSPSITNNKLLFLLPINMRKVDTSNSHWLCLRRQQVLEPVPRRLHARDCRLRLTRRRETLNTYRNQIRFRFERIKELGRLQPKGRLISVESNCLQGQHLQIGRELEHGNS